MEGYPLLASPTLYAGQIVRARIEADQANRGPVNCRLYIQHYGAEDRLIRTYSPEAPAPAGCEHIFQWKLADTGGGPIAAVGMEIRGHGGASGTVYLDELTWDGPPDVVLARPAGGGTLWRRAWVQGVHHWEASWPEAYHLAQNSGTGLLIQGTREWTDYTVEGTISTDLAQAVGIGARVQGMERYYALLLCRDNTVQLIKALDGKKVLAEAFLPWQLGRSYLLRLEVLGAKLRGWVAGEVVCEAEDLDRPLEGGAVALICEEGCLLCDAVAVKPNERT